MGSYLPTSVPFFLQQYFDKGKWTSCANRTTTVHLCGSSLLRMPSSLQKPFPKSDTRTQKPLVWIQPTTVSGDLLFKDLQSLLADTNLQTFSGHYDMVHYLSKDHQDKESIEKYIETAHQLGQKYIIAPVPPMFDINSLTPADYQYAAEQLNKAGEMAQKAGITVGFHNHFWELRQFANGTRGLTSSSPLPTRSSLHLNWMYTAGKSRRQPALLLH